MNYCENKKCNKYINTIYTCNKCGIKYCSNSCMIDHYFEKHQNNVLDGSANFSIKLNKRSSVHSSFLKKGEFLKDVKLNPHYDYKNLVKVKVGNKLHVLGSGAFGDVYLTKHKIDDKFYAVKQMQKEKISEAGATNEIIYREINIHSRLCHDNIIKLYSYDEDDNSFYLILEYSNSGTLFSLIKRSKGFDEATAFKYFIQAASAVYFIHENNLVHRDIKPENLLIDDEGNVKLCDFGWCVELSMGNRQTFCGTYEYMAPEIIREKPYNQSIDIWSLGILLYELLHGYSPFRALNNNEDEDYSEIFKNIIKYNFKIDKKVSNECKDLLNKLLTPDEKNRVKAKDIFSHPWVKTFEKKPYEEVKISIDKDKEIKEEIKKIEPVLSKPSNKHENKITDNLKNDKVIGSKKKDLKKDKSSPNVCTSKSDLRKHSDKIEKSADDPKEISRQLMIKNINQQKENSIFEALNSSVQEFSLLNNIDKSDNLFDKVLTQVKERNKDKKNKNSMNSYVVDVDKIILNETKNKKRNKSSDSNNEDNNNFTLLKEIKEIGQDLDKQNERYQTLKNQQSQLNNVIEKNKNDNIIIERFHGDLDYEEFEPSKIHKIEKDYYSKRKIEDIEKPEKPVKKIEPELVKKENLSKSNNKPPITKKKIAQPTNDYNDLLYPTRESTRVTKKNNSAIGSNPCKNIEFDYDTPKEISSRGNILAAIELLEKAQETKKEIQYDESKENGVWNKFMNFLNPFKCGK